jgi:hypothetical protein
LLKRKNTKIQEEKKAQAARLKALVAKMNEVNQMKSSDDSIPKDS